MIPISDWFWNWKEEQSLAHEFMNAPLEDESVENAWFDQYVLASVNVFNKEGIFNFLSRTGWQDVSTVAETLQYDEEALFRTALVVNTRGILDVDVENRRIQIAKNAEDVWASYGQFSKVLLLDKVLPDGSMAPSSYYELRVQTMLRTGSSAAGTRIGSFSDSWRKGFVDPLAAKSYNEFMRCQSLPVAIASAKKGIFSNSKRVVDLGGASASFSMAIKASDPEIECIVLDLPEMCEDCERYLSNYEELSVSIHAASFLENDWGIEADSFILCNILHDWSLHDCIHILETANKHMHGSGRLFIVERLLDENGLGPKNAVVFHMLMYMNHASGQLKLSEINRMLEETGFSQAQSIFTFNGYNIITANSVRLEC